jgi:signal transduction histidine kinase
VAWTDLLRGIVSIAGEERQLRSVLRQTARLVVAATGADACFVHVVDHDAREVVLMGATPDEFDELAGTIRLAFDEGVAGWVAEHGQPAVIDDKWSDPRYRYIPALRGEDFTSLVSVPLLRPPGVVVGVLNVHAHDVGHFAVDIVARLEEVASLLAGIVEAALLHEQLRVREEQLERFAARTIEMQELDRRRIAGDIHDGISQRLVSAWYHLRAAGSLTTEETISTELGLVDGLLSTTSGLPPHSTPWRAAPATSRSNSTCKSATCLRTWRLRSTASPKRRCRTWSSTPARPASSCPCTPVRTVASC